VIADFLRPGGTFYMVEFHPIAGIFDSEPGVTDLAVRYPYFPDAEPLRFEEDGSYADRSASLENRVTYSWPHPISEVVTSLIEVGLRIEFLHEFQFSAEQMFSTMQRGTDGYWRLAAKGASLPLLYSLRATQT
jgi:hypothetical protein